MPQSQDNILNVIRQEINRLAPGAKTILFGSRARNDFRADSDWDILILLNKESLEPADYDNISYPLYELGWRLNERISPKLYTTKEWSKRSFTPFYKNIEQEGIIL